MRNLRKTYSSPWWKWRNEEVVAIDDLTFDIPKFGIFVLLGSNGYVTSFLIKDGEVDETQCGKVNNPFHPC